MKFVKVASTAFPMEGRPGLGSIAVVAPYGVDNLVEIAGTTCPQCAEEFTPGEIVCLVDDPTGIAYIHDRDIKREEVE